MNRPVAEIPGPVVADPEMVDEPGAGQQIEQPRVLLVDDDDRNLLAVQSILEDVGEIVPARSGEEALRHLLRG